MAAGLLLVLSTPALAAPPNSTVTAPFTVTVGKNASLNTTSDTTSADMSFAATIDPLTLNATGSATSNWKVQTNSSGGASVSIARSAVTYGVGTPTGLSDKIFVGAVAAGGGTTTFTPFAKYTGTGAALTGATSVPTTAETLGTTNAAAGTAFYNLVLSINATPADGAGL